MASRGWASPSRSPSPESRACSPRRWRAFEPDRVRDIPAGALSWSYWLALGGLVLVIASMVRGWLDFLDGRTHPVPNTAGYVLWIAVALVGFAAAAIAFYANKDGA